MSPEQQLPKKGNASKRHKKAGKTCQGASEVPVHSTKDAAIVGNQQPSYPNPVGKSLNKLDPATTRGVPFSQIRCNNTRVCYDRQKCIDCSMYDRPNEINLPLVQMSKAAEAFINQKLIDVFRSRDGAGHQSIQFLEVLEILNSNKEIFMKLLQDPNSLLMKHIQDLRDYQAKKDQKRLLSRTKSLEYWFSLETPWKEPGYTRTRCMHNILPKNEEFSFRPASLSFTNIKRKLKHAIGGSRKEQLWTSTVQNLYKLSYGCLGSKDDGDGIGGKIAGINSPNKAYSGVGKTVQSSISVKRSDSICNTKDSDLSTRHEVVSISERVKKNLKLSIVEYGKQRDSSIYVQAKEHISEILSDEVRDRDFSNKKVSRTLENILSSPELNLSPIFSPRMSQNHGFVTAQMILSPYNNYYMANENCLRLQEEKESSCPSPVRQNAESPPCTDKELNNQSQITDLKPLIIEDVFPDTRMPVSTSSVTGFMEIKETSNSLPLVQSNRLEVPSESNTLPTLSANQCTDAAKRCEENAFLECLRPDLPLDNQQPTSLVVFSSSPISSYKLEDLDSIKDKVEGPSPVSVLEPFFKGDSTSPADTMFQSAPQPPIQPLCIHFEEQCSSGTVISPSNPEINLSTGMDDHASASDHVPAVLLASSLNWDELVAKRHLPQQPVDLDKMEVLSIQSWTQHKLLSDCINEVVVDIYQQHFGTSPWVSNLKPKIPLVSLKNFMVREVINGVDRHLPPQEKVPLEQLIVKDMEKSGTWVNIRIDIENIAIEMVEGIVQELTEETIVELQL